jgi:hypothetical protein
MAKNKLSALLALQTKNGKNAGEKFGGFRVPHCLNYREAKKEEIVM